MTGLNGGRRKSRSGGIFSYTDPGMPGPSNVLPCRGVTVQLWDKDSTSTDDSLGSAITDDTGGFQIGPVSNVEESGNGKQDVYIVALARDSAADVRSAYDGPTYKVQSQTHQNMSSGVLDTTITLNATESGPFFVADAMLEARKTWLSLRQNDKPARATVELKASQEGNSYNSDLGYIHIESGYAAGRIWPDTYDRDACRHEYSHKLEYQFGFFDHGGGRHKWDSLTNPRLAACEGAASFISAILQQSPRPVCYNSFNSFLDTFWINLENGEMGTSGGIDSTWKSANNCGRSCEAAIAGILWDIYDTNGIRDTLEDYGTFGQCPSNSGPHHDGIGDSLSDGLQNILSALLDRSVNGHHPDSIDAFSTAWFQTPDLRHLRGMTDIFWEHGIDCCTGTTGNVNLTGGVDLADLSMLVSFLTVGTPAPVCRTEANINAVGVIDLADMSALVSYLTGGGYILPACP